MEVVTQAISSVSSFLARTPKGPKIRYAVVAGGWISQGAFMPGVAQTNNSVMTVLISGDDEKTKLAAQYGLKFYHYNDFDKFLEADEADALYIATPNWMHRQFAVPALEKGYHVLLEKPMEVTEEDCEAIIAASKKSGAKLMIAYRLHCEPGTLNIIERVRNGDFGDARYFNSCLTQNLMEDNHRAKHGFNAGPIPDVGLYCINAVRNIFGQEPTSVQATAQKTPGSKLSLDDTFTVTLHFPLERTAQFMVSYTQNAVSTYTVTCTRGYVTADPAYSFGPGVKIAYKAKRDTTTETKEFPVVDQFGGETEYFSDCIINNKEVECDGEEGLLDVRVIEAIRKSAEGGGVEVKLPHRVRSKRPTLDQEKRLTLAAQPLEWIGRDSRPPSKEKN